MFAVADQPSSSSATRLLSLRRFQASHEGLDGGQLTRRQIAANRQALYTQSFKLAVEVDCAE